MTTLHARFTGAAEAAGRLLDALDASMTDAARRGAELVAASARAEHPYQNRTGDIERKTELAGPDGTFTAGTLVVFVEADTEYASFVDEGTARSRPFPFLLPAYEREEPSIVDLFNDAMREAAQRAGWVVS